MKIIPLLVALLLASSLSRISHGQEIEPVEVFEKTNLNKEAIRYVTKFSSAVKSGPESRSANSIVESSQFGVDAAKSQLYPTLSLGAVGSSTSTVDNRASATVQLRQPLYTGGRISSTIERAEEDVKISRERSNLILENLSYDILRAYIQLDQVSYQHSTGRALIIELEAVLAREKDRVQLGAGRINDVYFVQGRLNGALDRQITLETQFFERKAQLEKHIGRLDILPGDRLPTVSIPRNNIPSSLDEAIRLAMFGNTELRQSELNVSRAQKTVEIEQSSNFPSVDLVAIKQKLESSDPISGSRENDSINIQINFNAFAGGLTSNRVKQAVSSMSGAKEDLEIARRNVAQEVKSRWQRMESSMKKVPVQQQALKNNLMVLKERKILRNYGKESVQSVVDSIEDYFTSVQSTISSVFESKLAALDLSLISGKLKSDQKNSARFFAAFFGKESLEKSFLSMIDAPVKSSDELEEIDPVDLSGSQEQRSVDRVPKTALAQLSLKDSKIFFGPQVQIENLGSEKPLELLFETKWQVKK